MANFFLYWCYRTQIIFSQRMYCLTVLFVVFGGTFHSKTLAVAVKIDRNLDTASDVVHDCLDLKEKDANVGIWGVTFTDNLRSMTVQNCEKVVLNIATRGGTKRNLQCLTIRNVKNCEIIGWENGARPSSTSLPSHTTFANVQRMTVNVPLYGEVEFSEGVLQFNNVTIDRFKTKTIDLVSSSLKKFSVRGSTVMMSEKEAICFPGSLDSLLEIKDSFFYSVDRNFIGCNVTKTVIEKNRFFYAKGGSFSVKTKNFNSSGNVALEAEDCIFELITEDVQTVISTQSFSENDDPLVGRICVGVTAGSMKKCLVYSNKIYSNDCQNGTRSATKSTPHKSKAPPDATDEKGSKASGLVTRLSNRFFLLWFLALFILILMFPVAYFVKILFCRIIDNAFPLDVKHERLVNKEDI